jgi:hypothetical protein
VKEAGQTSKVIQREIISLSAETVSDMPQHRFAPVNYLEKP